jgi:hypothetical protein
MSAKKRTAQGTGLVAGGTYITSFGQQTKKLAFDQITGHLMKLRQEGPYKDLNKLNKTRTPNWSRKITTGESTRFMRATGLERKAAGLVKAGKAMNIVGAGMLAAEGIYKGTKRALGPGGTQFHTGTGVPVWEDRNTDNIGSKLNY